MTYNGQIHSFITQLSGRINRIEENALEAGLQEPISSAELKIIQAVGPQGCGKMGNIAAALGITLATLTVSCDKLEARGFLCKTRDPADKRTVQISLSEKGLVAYRFHSSFVESLAGLMLENLSEQERDVLKKCIVSINKLFEDFTKESL